MYASVYWLVLISPKLAHILKYFAQLCDIMIEAFRNSEIRLIRPPIRRLKPPIRLIRLIIPSIRLNRQLIRLIRLG